MRTGRRRGRVICLCGTVARLNRAGWGTPRDGSQVGISSVWYEGNPCNMHLMDLAAAVKQGVEQAGMVGMRFNTIGVSDGISMGTDGMSYSLQSRDIIADSIETVPTFDRLAPGEKQTILCASTNSPPIDERRFQQTQQRSCCGCARW
jgi:dihydroxyacid dehydratase/phosphogluconate dehydratase